MSALTRILTKADDLCGKAIIIAGVFVAIISASSFIGPIMETLP